MNSFRTEAIIMHRTNYGEADRILALLTPAHGKLSAIAKGVRRPKSKLAGGLELFATCELTIMQGRGDMGVITSARMQKFYGHILSSYDRLSLAYDMLRRINKATETVAEEDFYYVLRDGFVYANEPTINIKLVELWFRLRLASLLGRGLNSLRTAEGELLQEEGRYNYDFQENGFTSHAAGQFGAAHIKLLRLAQLKNPAILRQVSGLDDIMDDCLWLARSLE